MKKTAKEQPEFKRRKGLSPTAIVILGFVAIIIVGAFFLCLPVSSKSREWTPFIDALFVSASMTCVTGYSFAPVGVYFSVFGQIVILILIQAGGLGFMTVTTFVMLLIRKKITFRDRLAIQNSLGQDGNKGVIKLVRRILLLTLCAEAAGMLLLLPVTIPEFGGAGIWHALFLSVSAFCNAGVDVFGDSRGFSGYISNPYFLLVVAVLIILGGLGFAVIMDTAKNKGRFRKLTLHSKIVLPVSGILILSGFFFFLGAEFNNPTSIGNYGTGTKILAAFFESVSCRTAGFSVLPQNSMGGASMFFRDILMFIGASPGSTGGGIKTTTLTVLIMTVAAGARRKDEVVVFRRSVSYKNVYKALSVLLTALGLVAALAVFLSCTEAGRFPESAAHLFSFENILHESFAAFSTSGMGAGLIPYLSGAGKCAVMLAMFMGRIGMLPVGLMFTSEDSDIIKYPEASIPIG